MRAWCLLPAAASKLQCSHLFYKGIKCLFSCSLSLLLPFFFFCRAPELHTSPCSLLAVLFAPFIHSWGGRKAPARRLKSLQCVSSLLQQCYVCILQSSGCCVSFCLGNGFSHGLSAAFDPGTYNTVLEELS